MNTDFDYIDSDAAFVTCCDQLKNESWLALDTEFMRERTYYAELSLIQIASSQGVYLIDPLALGELNPLGELLTAPDCVKIFHSPDQDLEIVEQTLGVFPEPVFDTQLAAAMLGKGEQLGYAGLVDALLGVSLDKGQTRTDWHKRPLSRAQCQYAAQDVAYLHPMYEQLAPLLADKGREFWMAEELQQQIARMQAAANPENAWQRLKGGARLPLTAQYIAKRLAVWRERRAQARNMPREWILRTASLLALARIQPAQRSALYALEGVSSRAVNAVGNEWLSEIRQGQVDAQAAGEVPVWFNQQAFSGVEKHRIKAILQHVHGLSEELQVASSLILNRRTAEQIVRAGSASGVLSGWRAELLLPGLDPLLAN